MLFAEAAKLTFVNCVRFLAFEGVTRLSPGYILEYIFCCSKDRSEGQLCLEKFSFLATGIFQCFVSNHQVRYFRIRSRQLVSQSNSDLFRFIRSISSFLDINSFTTSTLLISA